MAKEDSTAIATPDVPMGMSAIDLSIEEAKIETPKPGSVERLRYFGYGWPSLMPDEKVERDENVAKLHDSTGLPIGALQRMYMVGDAEWRDLFSQERHDRVRRAAELLGKKTTTEMAHSETPIVDILAIMPWSPAYDWKSKRYTAASKELTRRSARPFFGPPEFESSLELAPFIPDRRAATSEELDKIIYDYQLEQARGKTAGAHIVTGISQLPAYVIEFSVAGHALGSGPKVKGVKTLAQKVGTALANAGILTTVQPHRISSSLAQQYQMGREGPKAVAMAIGDVYIENISEMTGEAFGTVGKAMLNELPFTGRVLREMQKYAAKIGMSEDQFLKRVFARGGYHGLINEWPEERVATILRGAMGVNDFGAGPEARWYERVAAGLKEDMKLYNQLIEGAVLATPAGVKMLAKSASNLPIFDTTVEDAMKRLEQELAKPPPQEVQDAERTAQKAGETGQEAGPQGQEVSGVRLRDVKLDKAQVEGETEGETLYGEGAVEGALPMSQDIEAWLDGRTPLAMAKELEQGLILGDAESAEATLPGLNILLNMAEEGDKASIKKIIDFGRDVARSKREYASKKERRRADLVIRGIREGGYRLAQGYKITSGGLLYQHDKPSGRWFPVGEIENKNPEVQEVLQKGNVVPVEVLGKIRGEKAFVKQRPSPSPSQVEGKTTPLYHVGVELKPGDKMTPDSRGLVWFSQSQTKYGADQPGVPVTKIALPADKILTEDSPEFQSVLDASDGSKQGVFEEAEKRGYLAVQRGFDVSMRPETAEQALAPSQVEGKTKGEVPSPYTAEEEEFLDRFRAASERVQRAEKTPDREMSAEEAKLMDEDWEAYSRRRGYTEADIQDFKDYLAIYEEGLAGGFTEDLLSDVERVIGLRLAGERATENQQLEAEFRKAPAPSEGPLTKDERRQLQSQGYSLPEVIEMDVEEARKRISTGRMKPTEKSWGADNTGVTREEYDAIKAKVKKSGRLKGGKQAGGTIMFSPEEWQDLVRVGRFHFEAGARAFGKWSRRMIADFGSQIKPHLKAIWDDISQGIPSTRRGERRFVESLKKQGILRKGETAEYQVRNTGILAAKAAALVKEDITKAREVATKQRDDAGVATACELLKELHREAQTTQSQAAKDVLYKDISELSHKIAFNLTEAGRTVQAASILGLQTPQTILRFAAREINRYNEAHRRKLPHLTSDQARYITEEWAEIAKMPDGEAKARRYAKLMDYISFLTPNTLLEKLITVWRAGLLTGIKTSGLNTFSNVVHGVTETIKDIPAVGVDSIASLFTKERTVVFTTSRAAKGFAEGIRKGYLYFRTGYSERDVGSKLDYKRVNMGKGGFARGMQAYEEIVFRILGAEDQPFYYGAKARSIVGQAYAIAKSEGLKGKARESRVAELIDSPTDAMIGYAILDAETAVFQNRTVLGDIARAIQVKAKGTQLVIPFSRTPSAIAMQIVNYGPLGAIRNIVKNAKEWDQRKFSQEMGRAVLGTGFLVLGAELFAAGLMTLGRPKNEREKKLWELEGRSPNSILIGGKWRQAQVLGPAGLVLIIGGYFAMGLDEEGSPTKAIATALAGGAKSFSEQTFLRGLNTTLDSITNPERSWDYWVTGLAGSVVPTMFADIARASDGVERQSRGPVKRIFSRIPVLRQTLLEPRINVFGQDLPRYGGNAIEVMIDPTRPTKFNHDVVVDELRRLWDAGHRAAPTMLGPYAGYGALTPQQNTALWRRAGEYTYINLYETLHHKDYERVDDELKAKLLIRQADKGKLQARVEMTYQLIQHLPREQWTERLEELREGGLVNDEVERNVRSIR